MTPLINVTMKQWNYFVQNWNPTILFHKWLEDECGLKFKEYSGDTEVVQLAVVNERKACITLLKLSDAKYSNEAN